MGRGKPSATSVRTISPQTLILDNGAHSIKAGFSSPSAASEPNLETDCLIIQNCIARSQRDRLTYVGADIDTCADFGELAFRRPVEKGFIVNWESEKAIWEKSFAHEINGSSTSGTGAVACDPKDVNLVLTEAPNAPVVLQKNADEMVFEEFEFGSAVRMIAPALSAYASTPFSEQVTLPDGVPMECALVVDVGHSHSTVTPLYQGRPLQASCRRLEVGGKTLTNYLKEVLSRSVEVQKEDWIVQEIKEDVCYVSDSFSQDLEKVWKGGMKDPRPADTSIVVDYVLPDYEDIKRGFARAHNPRLSRKDRALGVDGGRREHIITIANERFTVPELLFTPQDIGMQQEGLPQTILQSVYSLPRPLWQPFLANIIVVGGSSQFPGFMGRLESEIRKRVSDEYLVRIAGAANPLKNTWLGGARLARNPDVLGDLVVTRAEYFEHGDLWTRRKFAGMAT